MTDIKVEDGLFKPTIASFVDKQGEVFSVPSTRFRTISDLKSYTDNEVNLDPSETDETGYIPLDRNIERFFRAQSVEIDTSDDFDDYGEEVEADVNYAGDILDNIIENNQNFGADDVSYPSQVVTQPKEDTELLEEKKSPMDGETASQQQV